MDNFVLLPFLFFATQKNIQVTEVPCAKTSLNDGDVFVLDAGDKIHLVREPQPRLLNLSPAVHSGTARGPIKTRSSRQCSTPDS